MFNQWSSLRIIIKGHPDEGDQGKKTRHQVPRGPVKAVAVLTWEGSYKSHLQMYSVVKWGLDRQDSFYVAREGRTETKEAILGVSNHLRWLTWEQTSLRVGRGGWGESCHWRFSREGGCNPSRMDAVQQWLSDLRVSKSHEGLLKHTLLGPLPAVLLP